MSHIAFKKRHLPSDLGDGRWSWAAGSTVSVFSDMFSEEEATAEDIEKLSGDRAIHENAGKLRDHAAYTETAPLQSKLPISYHVIPAFIRKFLAKIIGAVEHRKLLDPNLYPSWPIDLSVDFLMDLAGSENPFRGIKTPVILSHDLDSPEGLQNSVKHFLPIEEKFNAVSENYFVPCAWKVDGGLLDEIASRGHVLGIHGYDHSNRTAFCQAKERRERIKASAEYISKYDIKGYRAPALLRSKELMDDLAGYYKYDSSIPTSGGLFPVIGNGCGTARPYRIGKLWEIPLSIPRDGSLIFLNYNPERILDLWIKTADMISKSKGVVVVLTHCEKHFSGNPKMLNIYSRFLEYLSSDDRFEFSNSMEVISASSEAA